MTTIRIIAVSLALAATAGAALSQGALTRDQVKAEFAEAQRTGDILGSGETSQKLNEMHPNRYPAKPLTAGKTRAEVKVEFADAQRTGDILGNGETSQKLNEIYPNRYTK